MRKIILAILFFTYLVNYVTAQSWSPLGVGIGSASYHAVHSFATYNGELYAGGYFSTAGNMPANNIAKWNGTSWSPVSTGTDNTVRSLAVYNGELYAAGNFSMAGNTAVHHIAKWNGTYWSAVGIVESYNIKSMIVYNGELYAAGDFDALIGANGTSIAKWNGTDWSAVGGGVEPIINSVECLAVYNGELYAAGAHIGGGGVANHFSILKWNGSNWSTLVTIPASYTPDGALGDILSMTVYNGELYVAGTFSMMIDTITAYQIAKWNGTNWSAVGTGINPEAYPFGGDSDGAAYTFVGSLTVYDGALYAGGRFNYCGITATRNIAKWNGINWSGLGQGINGFVYALTAADTSLYAGGWFNAVNGNNIPASRVAKWGTACDSYLSQPDSINGNNIVCENTSQTYMVNTVAGATNYTWNLPPGWAGSSVTNSITTTVGAKGGSISVIANNNCGSSIAQTLNVTVSLLPGHPEGIMGNTAVCRGSTHTYFTNPVYDATSYIWTLPSGWIGNSTTSSIIVTAGNEAGDISVKANNSCGSGPALSSAILLDTIPLKPGDINGYVYVNTGQSHSYSINSINGTSGYNWSVSGGGNITVGQTTNKIEINWHTSGTYVLSVNAFNNCGTSTDQTLTIKVSAANIENPYTLQLFPNPSSGDFYLKAKRIQDKWISVDVLSMSGQPVFRSGKRQGVNDYSQLIDLEKITPGLYVVKITINDKTYVRSIAIIN